MKKVFLSSILLALVIVLFYWLWPSVAYTNFPPRAGDAWVAFGDSLTSGVGAIEGNDYPTLLGRRLGIAIINQGVPGMTTEEGLRRADEIAALKPRVVLLCLGGNDGLRGIPAQQMFQNLGAIIDRLHGTGAFVVLIGIRSASLLDKNQSGFKTLARQKKVLLVPNILDRVLGTPSLMADYVHPNDQGYEAIAKRLEGVLAPLLPELIP